MFRGMASREGRWLHDTFHAEEIILLTTLLK